MQIFLSCISRICNFSKWISTLLLFQHNMQFNTFHKWKAVILASILAFWVESNQRWEKFGIVRKLVLYLSNAWVQMQFFIKRRIWVLIVRAYFSSICYYILAFLIYKMLTTQLKMQREYFRILYCFFLLQHSKPYLLFYYSTLFQVGGCAQRHVEMWPYAISVLLVTPLILSEILFILFQIMSIGCPIRLDTDLWGVSSLILKMLSEL